MAPKKKTPAIAAKVIELASSIVQLIRSDRLRSEKKRFSTVFREVNAKGWPAILAQLISYFDSGLSN